MENTKTTIRKSDVTVGDVQVVGKPVVVEPMPRRVSSETIGKEIASRITGKLIGFDDLFDAKTKTFLTEAELVKKGACFVSVSMNKIMTDSDLVKKSRFTKEPTPTIRKTAKYMVIVNIDWQSYINKRGPGCFVQSETHANGAVLFENCKGITITKKGNHMISGVVFKVIEKSRYFDVNGVEFTDIKGERGLQNEYFSKTVEAELKAKAREAEKHGIKEKFDPQFRGTRIDSCEHIRAFGFDYQPTDRKTL